jgi:hypothetical protein
MTMIYSKKFITINVKYLYCKDNKIERSCVLMPIYREANRYADALAHEGCTMNFESRIYESCPYHIQELFLADSRGLTTPRLIPL